MMRLIVITSPAFLADEAASVNALFEAGLEILHLRKPHSSIDEVEHLLQSVSEPFRNRIVLHEHFGLVKKYGLKGIHLNARNPVAPEGFHGHISRSCHSLQEVEEWKNVCDYVFLSPIYDSISKEGYGAHFTTEQLQDARSRGLIDEKVVALAGICADNIPEVKFFGFGGVALLGDVWNRKGTEFIPHFHQLLQIIQSK